MNNKTTKTFPQVWKDRNGNLCIIYRDRVEFYVLKSRETKDQIDKQNPDCNYDYENIFGKGWNAYHESEMMRPNGFRKIHDLSEVRE